MIFWKMTGDKMTLKKENVKGKEISICDKKKDERK